MGCDIHVHIEVKINGRWEHWSAPDVGRDYSLFGRLAGVRDRNETPIAAPRGFVSDPSIATEIDWVRGEDAWHTPSWLTGEEAEALIMEWRKRNADDGGRPWRLDLGYLFGRGFDVRRPADADEEGEPRHPDGVEDCRIVFWFDS